MEKLIRSKSVRDQGINQPRNKSETNDSRSSIETRDDVKHNKRNSTQATPRRRIVAKSSTISSAINRRFSGRKHSMLKRLSECPLSASEEYTSVMQGFKETPSEPSKSIVASPRPRNRAISFNNSGQGFKYSASKLSSEFESALNFGPRPRGNTLPARFSDPAAESLPGGKNRPISDKNVFDIKLAWQGASDDLFVPTKKEKERHVSLSDLPQSKLSGSKQEDKTEGKIAETFQSDSLPGRGDKPGRKIPQRKKALVDLPKIEERDFIDHLQIKPSEVEVSYDNRQKGFTAEHTDEKIPAPQSLLRERPRSENALASYTKRERSFSSGYITGSKPDTARAKTKLSCSVSWDPQFINRPTSEITLNRNDIDAKTKHSEALAALSPAARRKTSQFAITRANVRRVGNATLSASRLLKIHYRENGTKNVLTAEEEEKELDKLFEEMKDCRYLRTSASAEMKI